MCGCGEQPLPTGGTVWWGWWGSSASPLSQYVEHWLQNLLHGESGRVFIVTLLSTGWSWWTYFRIGRLEVWNFICVRVSHWWFKAQNTARLPQGPWGSEIHSGTCGWAHRLWGMLSNVPSLSVHTGTSYLGCFKLCLSGDDFKLGSSALFLNGAGALQSSAEGDWICAIPEMACECMFEEALGMSFLRYKENYSPCFLLIF